MFRVSTNLAQLLVAFGSCMFRRSVRTPQVFWVEMVPTKYVSQKKNMKYGYKYIYICIYIYIFIFIYLYIYIYSYMHMLLLEWMRTQFQTKQSKWVELQFDPGQVFCGGEIWSNDWSLMNSWYFQRNGASNAWWKWNERPKTWWKVLWRVGPNDMSGCWNISRL